jgi:hypothetical protein
VPVAVNLVRASSLHIALDPVVDDLRASREKQILDLVKRMDEQQRKLDELSKTRDKASADLAKISDELQAAKRKMTAASGDLEFFGPAAIEKAIKLDEENVANMKKKLEENANFKATAKLPYLTKEQEDLYTFMVKGSPDYIAALKRGDLTAIVNPIKPETQLDRAAQSFLDARVKIADLNPKRQKILDDMRQLESQMQPLVAALESSSRDLARLHHELYTKPSIAEVNASIDNEQVFQAVFNPQDAEHAAMARELEERISAEWPLFQRARDERESLKQAWIEEVKATLAAGEKLSGYSGAIMISAYAQAGAKATDVALALRKGGLYGALEESLKQLTDFAITYALSGGEDVGYVAVDEKAIEQKVSAQMRGATADKPWYDIDELLEKTYETLESLPDKIGDAAIDKAKHTAKGFVPGKLIEAGTKCGAQSYWRSFGKDRNPALDATRERILKYIGHLNEPSMVDKLAKINENKSFNSLVGDLAEKAAKGAATNLAKWAAAAHEKAAWTEYFKHEIRSRVLFESYWQFKQIYEDEEDRYASLHDAQIALASQAPCERQDAFRVIVDKAFPESGVERAIAVSLKTNDIDSSKLRITVLGEAEKSVAPDRFEGVLKPVIPNDFKVHIKVETAKAQ